MRGVVWFCFVVATACINTSLAIDCSNPEDMDQPRCRKRTGPVEVSGGEEMHNQLRGVLQHMDSVIDTTGKQSAMAVGYEAELGNSREELKQIGTILTLRQQEIDEVAHNLLPAAQHVTASHMARAKELQGEVESIATDMQQISQAMPQGEFIHEQQRLLSLVEQLRSLRNEVELGSLQQEDEIQHQMLLEQGQRALTDSTEAEDGVVAMLESETSLVPLSDRVLTLLDHIIENLRQLRVVLQDKEGSQREEWEASLDGHQRRMEELMHTAGFMQSQAYAHLAHSQSLRKYLRALTAAQFGTLERYNTVKANIAMLGRSFDSSARISVESLPLFDELMFLLDKGDSEAYVRDASLYNPCQDDACGVCNGGGQSCQACDGVSGGQSVTDVCGVCGPVAYAGSTCRYFCDGVVNSGKMKDICGVCDGDDTSCAGCDGVPLSGTVPDRCGICGGKGDTCKAECPPASECPVSVQGENIRCPEGEMVNPDGYKTCCFNAGFDCVDRV